LSKIKTRHLWSLPVQKKKKRLPPLVEGGNALPPSGSERLDSLTFCFKKGSAGRRSGASEALDDLEGRDLIRATAIAGGAYGTPEKEYRRLLPVS
jgi:hypothetical protein